MRPKILTVQFRENQKLIAQERASLEREVGVYSEVEYVNALEDKIDWSDPASFMSAYQGLVIAGTGEFYFDGDRDPEDPARLVTYHFLDKLRPLFQYVFDNDIPTLGICYGHQLLGAFAGAQVRYDEKQKKSCSHGLKLMVDKNDYFLFSDLPDSFLAHYGHKDTLDRVPEGAVLLMSGGEQCRVSALQYKNNIFTTQFHPELNFSDMTERMKDSKGYLPEGTVAEEVFKDDPHSNTILHNFGRFVAMQAENEKVTETKELTV